MLVRHFGLFNQHSQGFGEDLQRGPRSGSLRNTRRIGGAARWIDDLGAKNRYVLDVWAGG